MIPLPSLSKRVEFPTVFCFSQTLPLATITLPLRIVLKGCAYLHPHQFILPPHLRPSIHSSSNSLISPVTFESVKLSDTSRRTLLLLNPDLLLILCPMDIFIPAWPHSVLDWTRFQSNLCNLLLDKMVCRNYNVRPESSFAFYVIFWSLSSSSPLSTRVIQAQPRDPFLRLTSVFSHCARYSELRAFHAFNDFFLLCVMCFDPIGSKCIPQFVPSRFRKAPLLFLWLSGALVLGVTFFFRSVT